MHFCSSENRESRIFGISALKIIVLRNKTKLFLTCNWSINTNTTFKRGSQVPHLETLWIRIYDMYCILYAMCLVLDQEVQDICGIMNFHRLL